MNQRDIFISAVTLREMLSRNVLTMDMIQKAFSGNTITYAVVFFRTSNKHKPESNNNGPERSNNNEYERTILALNNELQRLHMKVM